MAKKKKKSKGEPPHHVVLTEEELATVLEPETPIYETQYKQLPRFRRDYFSIQTEDL